jgi:hypothetical protein
MNGGVQRLVAVHAALAAIAADLSSFQAGSEGNAD